MKKLLAHFLIGMILGVSFFVILLKTNLINEKEVLGVKNDKILEGKENSPTAFLELTPTLEITPTPSLTPTPTRIPTPSSTPTPSLTSTPPATPTPINAPAYLENYFNQYAIHYNVSANLLKKIAWCESRFDPLVVNGPYVGLYQFMESIWITYRTQMGHDINPELRKNAEESIKTAAYIISLGKLHLWPNCVE
ncbi:hypothetical protein A2Z22_01080 [Candidatus Woesebacteria bacterium RBG_16_34_12]|uniref:Transglycosylase SLT domain-containing protein n=1 Tax=Candidatus Woesebacteria bacterium RBG_16_34_12 TaxID=1802480 RepID=A0A1F7X9W3_9BACT|nr:MAG: hypothetical protein A2Z22_01080 [Candidatus Woesebacteria bacterium RBG_16_34_12]